MVGEINTFQGIGPCWRPAYRNCRWAGKRGLCFWRRFHRSVSRSAKMQFSAPSIPDINAGSNCRKKTKQTITYQKTGQPIKRFWKVSSQVISLRAAKLRSTIVIREVFLHCLQALPPNRTLNKGERQSARQVCWVWARLRGYQCERWLLRVEAQFSRTLMLPARTVREDCRWPSGRQSGEAPRTLDGSCRGSQWKRRGTRHDEGSYEGSTTRFLLRDGVHFEGNADSLIEPASGRPGSQGHGREASSVAFFSRRRVLMAYAACH